MPLAWKIENAIYLSKIKLVVSRLGKAKLLGLSPSSRENLPLLLFSIMPFIILEISLLFPKSLFFKLKIPRLYLVSPTESIPTPSSSPYHIPFLTSLYSSSFNIAVVKPARAQLWGRKGREEALGRPGHDSAAGCSSRSAPGAARSLAGHSRALAKTKPTERSKRTAKPSS